MRSDSDEQFLHYLCRLVAGETIGHLSDRELLRQFVRDDNQKALVELIRRHGPLVLRVCRNVLQDSHAAEDAFQAVFVVLARRAGRIRRSESVASWLYKVAYRIAVRASRAAARRRRQEGKVPPRKPVSFMDEVTGRELQAMLDEELQRLPERYRAPLVLCCLEGRTRDEAAMHLGWSVDTLRGRLERGRQLLRTRLARRGVTLSAVMAPGLNGGTTGPSSALIHATAKVATLAKAGHGLSIVATADVAALARGVLKTMLIKSKLTLGVAVFVLLGAGLAALPAGSESNKGSTAERAVKGAFIDPAEQAVTKEGERLAGTWRVVSMESNGRKEAEETIQEFRYVFKGDGKWELQNGDETLAEGTYRIDPGKSPKTIDYQITTTVAKHDKGKTSRGIYELGGDTLKVCRTWPEKEERPTEFTASAESKRILTEMKREQPEAAGRKRPADAGGRTEKYLPLSKEILRGEWEGKAGDVTVRLCFQAKGLEAHLDRPVGASAGVTVDSGYAIDAGGRLVRVGGVGEARLLSRGHRLELVVSHANLPLMKGVTLTMRRLVRQEGREVLP